VSTQAIKTVYDGQTFRSRLEARWAIVFDHIGLPREYEPVLYDLPSGRYLPDFRIFGGYDIAFWIEVKGPMPDAREFAVGTEVNIYEGVPLVIFSGDIPRHSGAGTAWWFDPDERQWEMITPDEALLRIIFRGKEDRPETLGPVYDEAVSLARHARFGAREGIAPIGKTS
jgi:hypothetical protein